VRFGGQPQLRDDPGGIKSHLEQLNEAVQRWLEWDDRMNLDQDAKDSLIMQYDEHGPPQPEPLSYLYRLRRFNCMWWPGGYSSQPWLLMEELNACIEGEEEYKLIKAIELENKLKQLEGQQA
jgi:hypothetical protein